LPLNSGDEKTKWILQKKIFGENSENSKDRIKTVVKNHDDKNKFEKNIVINYEVR
jgi:hypothetical protein